MNTHLLILCFCCPLYPVLLPWAAQCSGCIFEAQLKPEAWVLCRLWGHLWMLSCWTLSISWGQEWRGRPPLSLCFFHHPPPSADMWVSHPPGAASHLDTNSEMEHGWGLHPHHKGWSQQSGRFLWGWHRLCAQTFNVKSHLRGWFQL